MKVKLLIMFIALFALAGNNGVNAQTKKTTCSVADM